MVRTDTEETQAVDVFECETPEPSRVGSTDSLLSTPLDVKCLRNQYQHPGGFMPSTLELGASEAPFLIRTWVVELPSKVLWSTAPLRRQRPAWSASAYIYVHTDIEILTCICMTNAI